MEAALVFTVTADGLDPTARCHGQPRALPHGQAELLSAGAHAGLARDQICPLAMSSELWGLQAPETVSSNGFWEKQVHLDRWAGASP